MQHTKYWVSPINHFQIKVLPDEPFHNFVALKSVARHFQNHMKFLDSRILKLLNWERARRVLVSLETCVQNRISTNAIIF